MSDTIFLRHARFPCHIGVTQEERVAPQDVLIDVDLALDLSAAGRSDSIRDTMDYRDVWALLGQCISEREFHLVEALATQIGDLLLDRFERVASVTIGVTKPAALAAKGVGEVGVRLTVARADEGRAT